MINIVKYPKTIYTRHRFQCPDCECIFDADANDYTYTTIPNGFKGISEIYGINCPICGHRIINTLKEIKTFKAIPNYTREDISISQYIE